MLRFSDPMTRLGVNEETLTSHRVRLYKYMQNLCQLS